MGMNFPDAPTLNQVFLNYTWDGEKWAYSAVPTSAAPSNANPAMNGAAAPGVAALYSRGDHVHPSDTSRIAKAGDTMTGALTLNADPAAPMQAATKQYVDTNSMTQAASDARYVNVAGDSMTGNLSTTGTLSASGAIASGGQVSGLQYISNLTATTGSYYFGNSGTKYLTFDGTNFTLNGGPLFTSSSITAGSNIASALTATTGGYYFGNSGTKYLTFDGTNFSFVGGPLYVNNANLLIGSGGATAWCYFGNSGTKYLQYDGSNFILNGGLLVVQQGVMSALTTTTGTFYFGSGSLGKYLNYDGANFNLTGGPLVLNSTIYVAGGSTTGSVNFGTSGTKYLNYDGTNFNLVGGSFNTGAINSSGKITQQTPAGISVGPIGGYAYALAYGGGTEWGYAFRPADNSNHNIMSFLNSATSTIGSITFNASAISFNTTSSADLKEDLKSFDAGRIIDDTNVYDFKWKSTGERSYGVVAQQAVDVYPTAVTHTINPENKDDEFWGVDYSKYVPVLLQELKALRTRVAELEQKVAPEGKPVTR